MLFRPTRLPRLLRLLHAARTEVRDEVVRPDDLADIAYLARLSDQQLERDLGLIRRGRDYRPY